MFCEKFSGGDGARSVDYVFYTIEASAASRNPMVIGFYTLRMVEPDPDSGVRQVLVGVPHNSIC